MVNLFLILFLFYLDYYLKNYVSYNLRYSTKKFFNNFLQIVYVENRGIAFNILENKKKIIYTSNLILLSYLIYLYFIEAKYKIPLTLIFTGGLGNFVDRIKRGYVVDYIYFNIKKFPVFNLSDFYIIGGAIMIAF